MIKDRGSILGAYVIDLPIQRGGIVHFEKLIEQMFVADLIRIKFYLHTLRVTGVTVMSVLIFWIVDRPAGESDPGLHYAGHFSKKFFGTPVAAGGEGRGFEIGGVGRAESVEQAEEDGFHRVMVPQIEVGVKWVLDGVVLGERAAGPSANGAFLRPPAEERDERESA